VASCDSDETCGFEGGDAWELAAASAEDLRAGICLFADLASLWNAAEPEADSGFLVVRGEMQRLKERSYSMKRTSRCRPARDATTAGSRTQRMREAR